jgi:hypothetical protein
VAGILATVLILADGLQAQTYPGGGHCGQSGQGSLARGRGRQIQQNILQNARLQNRLTNPNFLLNNLPPNGTTDPNTLLNALQRRQNQLQNALERTNTRLNILQQQQSGLANQTALVNALQQRQTALQNALQQVIALQAALQHQTDRQITSQPQPLLQQQIARPLQLDGMQVRGSQ